jgi:hypothetical protein
MSLSDAIMLQLIRLPHGPELCQCRHIFLKIYDIPLLIKFAKIPFKTCHENEFFIVSKIFINQALCKKVIFMNVLITVAQNIIYFTTVLYNISPEFKIYQSKYKKLA